MRLQHFFYTVVGRQCLIITYFRHIARNEWSKKIIIEFKTGRRVCIPFHLDYVCFSFDGRVHTLPWGDIHTNVPPPPHTITGIGQLPRTYPTKLRCCDISSYKLSNESTCLVFQGPSKLTFPSDNWLEYKRGTPPAPLCTVAWTPRRFNYEAFGEDSNEGGNFGYSL